MMFGEKYDRHLDVQKEEIMNHSFKVSKIPLLFFVAGRLFYGVLQIIKE
jgi:hypothetical protein